eukprot:CAMPEP_0171456694 /NCGR_PEP_ID=MMETSP0945-20130129/3069_1 /TAXON_ID=109269 /ORGANISM="Vaucheria litorea, Strain CCMP2940" /LENGTH=540 /DNA_ID=CAMNT_0011982151 /DNA_START=449 /DNA_END=2071 /DNA_ORIENTATION=-
MTPYMFGAMEAEEEHMLSEQGLQAYNRILVACKQMLAVNWCPAIIEIVRVFLLHMPEGSAYYAIEEMWEQRPLHFPVTRVEAKAWSLAFGSIVEIFFPKLFKVLEASGALTRKNLECIFHRFFVPLLPLRYVCVIWDSWFKEGSKIIFRYALGLISFFKSRIKALKLGPEQGHVLWSSIKNWAKEDNFNFEALSKVSFGIKTSFWRRPLTWNILEECTDTIKEHPFLLEMSEHNQPLSPNGPSMQKETVDVTFYWPPFKLSKDSSGVLLQEEFLRATLVKWVPQILRHKELRCIFSTESNGYSLAALYRLCKPTSPSLLIIEVQDTNELIGAYCTDGWHLSNTIYGSGQCFLFKLNPEPTVYKWRHTDRRASMKLGNVSKHRENSKHKIMSEMDSDDVLLCRPNTSDAHPFIHPLNHLGSTTNGMNEGSMRGIRKIGNISQNSIHRLQEILPYTSRHQKAAQRAATLAANESSFMFGTPFFMGLGASSTDVSCGLKIHEGLVRGSSGPCATFGNPCLVAGSGRNGKKEFDISCVEVYAFS